MIESVKAAGIEPAGTRAPLAVMIGGLPGSGKTTLGRALAARIGGALLDLDTLTNPLMARIAELVGAGDNLDHPALRGQVRAARYRCLRDTVAEVVGSGCSVVAVAPFTIELTEPVAWQQFSAPIRAAWQDAKAAGSKVVLVQTVIDPQIASARRADRGLPRDRDYVPPIAVGSTTAQLRADGAAGAAAEADRLVRLLGAGLAERRPVDG